MQRKRLEFNSAVQQANEKLNKLPPSARPGKKNAGSKIRTEEERRALFRASYWDTQQAKKAGLIVKTERGFRMSWAAEKKS